MSLAEISQRQGISLSYLEQLFAKLRKQDLVLSVRGPGGGYKLGRPEDRIFIAEVVDAVSESIDTTRCQHKGNCQEGETCLTHHLWIDLSEQIHQFLSSISLHDLMKNRDIQLIAERQNMKIKMTSPQSLSAHSERALIAREEIAGR